MKFRHRIKFTIDNISLHGKQVRAGIFMSFFAFLVLGVTVFIFKTTGQFRKDTQKAFAEDISGVGCIEISSDDEKKAMDFINRMRTQAYITMAGSISEYEISQENWDAVSTRQSVNKRVFDELRDADSYTEVLFVQKDVFSLFDIRLKKGSEDVNTVMKKGYVPLYVGYKYQKDLKIGDVLPDSDDFEYMVAGYIDKNQSMPVNSMVTVDKFSFYTTTSLDYALIAVVDWEPDACGENMYFEIADGYKFQDVKYRLTLLAGTLNSIGLFFRSASFRPISASVTALPPKVISQQSNSLPWTVFATACTVSPAKYLVMTGWPSILVSVTVSGSAVISRGILYIAFRVTFPASVRVKVVASWSALANVPLPSLLCSTIFQPENSLPGSAGFTA